MSLSEVYVREIVTAGAAPPSVPLGVPYIKQQQDNWCWAACVDMVLDYYEEPEALQCILAAQHFGFRGCCPKQKKCDLPCQLNDMAEVYQRAGIRCSFHLQPLSFDKLNQEIMRKRPVQVGYAFNGWGGHAVLVVGCYVQNQKQYVHVHDPYVGSGTIRYSDLMSASGKGSWKWTWYGLKR